MAATEAPAVAAATPESAAEVAVAEAPVGEAAASARIGGMPRTRRRKIARERREQALRSQSRMLLRLARGIRSIESHRGNTLPRVCVQLVGLVTAVAHEGHAAVRFVAEAAADAPAEATAAPEPEDEVAEGVEDERVGRR